MILEGPDDDAVQWLAVEILEGHVLMPVDLSNLVRLNDVCVVQPRSELPLVQEHLLELGILRHIRL